MSYTMYPYDGVGNIPDAVFHWFWGQMEAQGLVGTVFCSGGITDSYKFMLLLKTQAVPTIFINDEDRPICLAWLSDVGGTAALGHFCFLKEGRQYKMEIGDEMLRFWTETLGLKTILGIVPSFNKQAIEYVSDLGLVILGEIPSLIMHNGKYESAVIGYYNREETRDG